VNLFVLLYLTDVIRLDPTTTNVMYGVLIVLSVPAPLVAGWLSDRLGRKPLIVGVYLGGAVAFVVFIAAGSGLVGLWLGIALMGGFSFAESPQLQALLADLAPPEIRDAAFGTYFTLAFGIGALWAAVYGAVIDLLGEPIGLPAVFVLMAISFVAAAASMLPVDEPPPQRERDGTTAERLAAI
jgi:MFS family permease